MSCDGEPTRKIPSLVQYCQRVATAHADALSSVGDEIRYELIKPVLTFCSPETLLRLETASPYIEPDTPELWKCHCERVYPMALGLHYTDKEPESWREVFFELRELEAKRLEEVGSRIRNQRLQAEERKREREIKITDKLPPAKRGRWSMPSQPKTLFQKTRSDAARMQKSVYGPRMIPAMPPYKSYAVISTSLAPKPPLPSSNPRVTVTAVRRPATASLSPLKPTSPPKKSSKDADQGCSTYLPTPSPTPKPSSDSDLPAPSQMSPPPDSDFGRSPGKKDLMSTLFMPKHRAHSQRPMQSVSTRKVPAR
ncbi:hypothetical protein JAAARDRAFT_191036 [Jaapia argillacea MUCL 33604]|uniref:Elongin-A n=1 Tax=Jaapia argillacea MUCL 33604 TaxID=933084 RepID=A0A067QE82_9AGAM|nr:hypothetical protein JAAARDRAFT_191036 [Jaapia argillacea MUCL 33604]